MLYSKVFFTLLMYLDSVFLRGVDMAWLIAALFLHFGDSQSMNSDSQGRLYTRLKDRIKHGD